MYIKNREFRNLPEDLPAKKKKGIYTFMCELGLKRCHTFYQLLVVSRTQLLFINTADYFCLVFYESFLCPYSMNFPPLRPPPFFFWLKWISVTCNQKSTSTQIGKCVTKQTWRKYGTEAGNTEHFPIPEWKAVNLWKQ